ncbi:protein FAM184B isoform X3 [Rhineura floridana]|uniref:protein FAM184B isoform X3 n=1 Tax=Rhineura floridana TaxID=261503 RepID=UPI002AC8887F|nr:protein FAM184B isoform X3 [Rhineura floridana]
MASGINKIHQLGTCDGSSKANNQCRSLAESDPDMHMKMCKKIAQLTKVIYALNAKNDEYEASIQALKEAHQEEIQHILAETRKTIPQYNSKAEELQKRVQDLEEALEKCRRLKEEAPSKFTKSKKQTKEGEPQREDKPIDEKIVLPKEMAHMKLSFEGHSSNNESDGLVNKHWVFVGDTLDCKGKLSEMYSMEMEAVMSEAAHLRWENQKLAGEYAEKISQLQASHEREKEIWRKAVQQSLADSGREWQQREMEQKKNYETREDASQQQVKKLEADLAAKSQQISEMKKHSQKLKEKMQDVQIQLDELKKKYEYEIRHLQNDKEAVQGKLQDCSLEVLRLENFIRQNRDIPKYAEFLKSHARKTRERQQEDAFVQQQDISKQLKERAKGRVQLTTPLGAKNEEKSRLDSGGASKREDRQTLPHFQKEKSKEKRALQEEWYYQKTELQAQVTQLKQMLEQQANAFRDTLKEQELQSSKAREKLLQDLQDTIKQSQDIKAQLEASHQRAINLLKKSKNQELKEAEEYWKQKYHDSFKVQQQSHSLEIRALEEKAREELERELERMQKPQSLLIDSLRMELSEQQINNKEKDKLQEELKNMMAVKRQEEENHQNQIKFLRDELEKCQSEMSGLKKENSLLKDTKDLLSVNVELQKQTSGHLQDRESQLRRLQELEGKERKREPRLEDLHLIDCLRDKLNEKEEMIKELMDGRKLQHSLLPSAEPCRNRSFSFNSKPITCLTTTAKQKKKMDEAPSRIVSVPNLASYAKSFLSGDLRPKKNPPQITKSTSLDQNPDCVRVCYPSLQALETKQVLKLQSNETSKPKDAQKPDPRHQEWFTKYFSF